MMQSVCVLTCLLIRRTIANKTGMHIVDFGSLLLILWQHAFTFTWGGGYCLIIIIILTLFIAPPIRPTIQYKQFIMPTIHYVKRKFIAELGIRLLPRRRSPPLLQTREENEQEIHPVTSENKEQVSI